VHTLQAYLDVVIRSSQLNTSKMENNMSRPPFKISIALIKHLHHVIRSKPLITFQIMRYTVSREKNDKALGVITKNNPAAMRGVLSSFSNMDGNALLCRSLFSVYFSVLSINILHKLFPSVRTFIRSS
jgi:hypothetical protein